MNGYDSHDLFCSSVVLVRDTITEVTFNELFLNIYFSLEKSRFVLGVVKWKMEMAIYNYEITPLPLPTHTLSGFEVGRQSNPVIDFISIGSQLLAVFGPMIAPAVMGIISVLAGTVGIAVANALFQAEQDRINAEAAASNPDTVTVVPGKKKSHYYSALVFLSILSNSMICTLFFFLNPDQKRFSNVSIHRFYPCSGL